MSWEDSLQDASFRGVRFDVVNTRDSASRDIATYEYPYVDGGDVDDLGRKPRNLRMTVLFWGDDYEVRLQAFLAALDTRGSAELIHPVFGSMTGMQCIEYQASHEAENVDYCVVEVVFIQGDLICLSLAVTSRCRRPISFSTRRNLLWRKPRRPSTIFSRLCVQRKSG
ncbi:DNA circularization N-terminal domain-containing protein [Citrobacter farmeri]